MDTRLSEYGTSHKPQSESGTRDQTPAKALGVVALVGSAQKDPPAMITGESSWEKQGAEKSRNGKETHATSRRIANGVP